MRSFLFNVPEAGVYNSVFAAASITVREQAEVYKGGYLTPVGKITKPSPLGSEIVQTTDRFLQELL